ncbi:MAG: tRNA pseudouridine(55) synthase TruB [Actinobacteria bacterium]|uniref:tRNA pseudouridine(55) synthase n=1 Tax=freshwater metagenome TaxID=449393 RepID=A0A6J6JNJ7_9ZZZZ|nr:tRNA pseudouridine(55) synthase TruB [Actinomycetota bacterium]
MLEPGLVLIDKPTDWTSHDVVAKVRKAVGTKKVGHAGTLDPLATGLLVLGIESGTKLLTFLVGADKTYLATIRLGVSTVSDDSQSEILTTATPAALAQLSPEMIEKEMAKLTGVISQRPSSVSAIKVDGKRAYDLVRAGEEVELKSREVTVGAFELLSSSKSDEGYLDLEVKVDCSSGTYIRALARDLGAALGVGGHITALRRTKVGSFDVSDANSITDLENLRLTPLAKAASDLFPTVSLSDAQVTDLVHGKRLSDLSTTSSLIAGLSGSGQLVAVLEPAGSGLKSVVVFQGEQK